MIIGITTSGKSENILRALVGHCNIKSILITGKNGREIAEDLNGCIVVDDDHTQTLEDVFSILCHIIAIKLREDYEKGKTKS